MIRSNKFGTFSGVFTPSILTILGVIMYLRLPMIVGEAGLLSAIGIIVIAHIISFATGLSVSSIATDKKVQAGGTYYIVSRSLGLPIGGTLGLALFVGLSFSVSLYLIGFAESFLGYWGWEVNVQNIRIAGSVILLVVTTITFISTSLAIRTQYIIMAAIFLSLLSIFFGKHEFTPEVPLITNPNPTVPLMVLFGIFFPAVTGFEAGVSMSGDLKDPKKSIPGGTIAAVLVGFLVYIGLVFFFTYTVDSRVLADDPQVLTKIALVPELVIAGIWGATLSSALGSILGAPRILQATATDRITPRFFARGYGSANEPRHALLFTFLIAETGILIGELDVIARIVSIFFITTYGFLNLSSAFEYWTSPDFRPEFRIPSWVSVIGALACFIVMIQLDLLATFGATLMLGLLFLGLKRRELTLESGDAWSGIWASLVNTGIKRLNQEKLHFRNWRPNILMFRGSEEHRPYMVDVGIAMTGKLGVLTDINLIEDGGSHLPRNLKKQVESETGRVYFRQDHHCRDVYSGVEEVTRIYGFSGVEPNTIFMGWSRHPQNKDRFIEVIKSVVGNNINLIFLDYKQKSKYGDRKTVDIWWSGTGRDLSFALSLMRHFTASGAWPIRKMRLLAIKNNDQPVELIQRSIERILEQYRMQMEVKIINNYVEKLSAEDIISRESASTDMTIIDISDAYFKNLKGSYVKVSDLLDRLGSCMIIHGSELFEDIDVGLGTDEQKKEAQLATAIPKDKIPDLHLSKYSEVAAEVTEALTLLESATSELYRNGIVPEIDSGLSLIQESAGSLTWAIRELRKMEEVGEKYRKEKILKKVKNDLFFRFKEDVKAYGNEEVPRQTQLLGDQITMFDKSIYGFVRERPARLRIVYYPEDLQPVKEDSGAVRFVKWKKRVQSKMSDRPASGSISYRKMARYFLYENRHRWLTAQLDLFLTDRINFYQTHKQWIRQLLNILEDAENSLESGTFRFNHLINKLEEMHGVVEQLAEGQRNQIQVYNYNREVEQIKNLQQFNNYLERIHAVGGTERKRRSKKYFRKIIQENLNFGDLFREDVQLTLNGLSIELQVNAVQSRVLEVVQEYMEDFEDKVNRYYLKELTTYLEQLNKLRVSDTPETDEISIEIDSGLKFAEDFQTLSRDVFSLIEQLPEMMTVTRDPGIINKGERLKPVETMEIPLRKIGGYFIESRLVGPLEQHFEEALIELGNSIEQTTEVNNLMIFSFENVRTAGTENEKVGIDSVTRESIQKISEQEKLIVELLQHLETNAHQLLMDAFEPLGTARIRKSTSELSIYLRDYQGKRVISRFDNWKRFLAGWIQKNILKILYSRSEGVLLAKRLQSGKFQFSLNSRLLDFNDLVSPKPEILRQLPPYYVNLFSGRSSVGKEFWINRPVEMSQSEKALQRYEAGRKGAILVVGERNSGKTLLSKNIAYQFYKEQHVYQVFPPSSGSLNEDDLAAAFRKASGAHGGIHQILASVPAGRVWILHDLELWWERSDTGMRLVELVGDLIDRYAGKYVFIINLNPFALALLNRRTDFNNYFIETIHCRPFDAEELRDLILRRHETSGLKLTFRKAREEILSEVKMATLFHDYFRYSRGNPGVALNAWLANIRQVYGNNLLIRRPDISGINTFRELPDDWYATAAVLALHKRLDTERLLRLTGKTRVDLEKLLLGMQRAMIVTERLRGLYVINQFIEPHLLLVLKEKELI